MASVYAADSTIVQPQPDRQNKLMYIGDVGEIECFRQHLVQQRATTTRRANNKERAMRESLAHLHPGTKILPMQIPIKGRPATANKSIHDTPFRTSRFTGASTGSLPF